VWREVRLVAAKDLRIELRSRVGVGQIAPFAVLVLVLFGFALDADTRALRTFTGGLFWVTVLFAAVLAIQRAFAVESHDGNRDALRLSGMEPASIFLGKAVAVALELLALEAVLGLGVAVLYGPSVDTPLLLVATSVVATVGVAAAGTLYGVLAAGLRVRETILPILLLPVLAPVLIGATRAFDDALGAVAVNGWSWLGLLGLAAVVYVAFGALAFGVLLEES
jgi:heme exporter protein B